MIGALLSTDFAERRARAANDRLLRRGLPGPFPLGWTETPLYTTPAAPKPDRERVLLAELKRVTDHLETWANDHTEERTADIEAAIYCARQALLTHPTPDDDFDWRKAAINLAMRESDYRLNHDVHGDGSREAGRSWDRMRHSGNAIRAAAIRNEAAASS